MSRWILTTTVLLTLLTGTALMASADGWTVIGDGYVPVAAVDEAEPPPTRTETQADTPWIAVEDGYVLRWGETQAAPDMPPACCAEACPGADCEYTDGNHWSVAGDGYITGRSAQASSAMVCC